MACSGGNARGAFYSVLLQKGRQGTGPGWRRTESHFAPVKSHPHIPRPVDIRLPDVGYQYPGAQDLVMHFRIQLLHQDSGMPSHPVQSAVQKLTAFRLRDFRAQFPAQVIVLYLFLQGNKRKVIIVIPYPELFPPGNAVPLLAQRLVRIIIKVDAPYQIPPVRPRMGIGTHDSLQAAPKLQIPGISDFIFQFVAKA